MAREKVHLIPGHLISRAQISAGLRAHLRRGSITQGEGSCDPGVAYDELLAGRVRDCLREVAGVGMSHG
jgi:hypothetical protein